LAPGHGIWLGQSTGYPALIEDSIDLGMFVGATVIVRLRMRSMEQFNAVDEFRVLESRSKGAWSQAEWTCKAARLYGRMKGPGSDSRAFFA
jgi:hypothetical protein